MESGAAMSKVTEITFEVIEPKHKPRYFRVVSRQGVSGENAERFIMFEGDDFTYAQTVMRAACKAAVDGRADLISMPAHDWEEAIR
jgi:hypothetical protein